MSFLRILAFVTGLVAIAFGLFWVGQGTGIVDWPPGSSMLGDRTWAVRGAVMAAVGTILLWLARRGNVSDNRL